MQIIWKYMKRPNYGKTPTYLIFMINQQVWWCNTKGEVNDPWKPLGFPIVPKLLSCCTADRSLLWSCGLCWEVYNCQQEEMWPSGVLRFLHTGKNQLQMEQAWFPGLWEEDENHMESCAVKLQEICWLQELWRVILYEDSYIHLPTELCFQMDEYLQKTPHLFFSVKLRWLEQLILFFM